MQPDFSARVRETVRAAGVEPQQLMIELTESVLIEKLAATPPQLKAQR